MTPAQAAAQKYANSRIGFIGPAQVEQAFLAGCEWTLAHHPKVLALVEALEKISTVRERHPAANGHARMSWAEAIALDALAAFRDGKGEK